MNGLDKLPKSKKEETIKGLLNLANEGVFDERMQEIDGFKIGFLRKEVLEKLCNSFGLPKNSEAFLMQADDQTVPHVHENGHTILTALGAEHGYPKSRGGTFLGKAEARSDQPQELMLNDSAPGELVEIGPGEAHFFAPLGEGSEFVAVGFVCPPISNGKTFDIAHFEGHSLRVDGRRAVLTPNSESNEN